MTRHRHVRLLGEPGRVIVRPFLPGEQTFVDGPSRIEYISRRILSMPENEVVEAFKAVVAGFAGRHRNLNQVLTASLARVAERVELPHDLTEERRLLLGAYFVHEYSFEAAALGNPSMVPAPDQSGLGDGQTRFVMSLRAIGEGHISSIEFRSGVVGPDMAIQLDPVSRYAATGAQSEISYDTNFFLTKLRDLGVLTDRARLTLERLGEHFTMRQLETMIGALDLETAESGISVEVARALHWLASSNHGVSFPASSDLSERIIFPAGPTESHGMEDVRLVRFVHDDGRVVYYGTYTAFDGHQILPQLLETVDFVSFRIATLSGACAQNKGIALFPRKLGGQYVALGRHDNVNNFLMTSPDVRVWRETQVIQEPERSWELVQLGNCGSPVETEAGWLVITHGVGPFRQYALGALLLDREDPCRVIGHLKEPLLQPTADEREGYVPNVVYSCGSMVHDGHLVLPYGYADVGASIATVRLDALLDRLVDR